MYYKVLIMQLLEQIDDEDEKFLKQIYIIVWRHIHKK